MVKNSGAQCTYSTVNCIYKLGSVTAITDDTGMPVKYYHYDPFGNVTNTTEDPINNFTFVGRYGGYKDWDSGFINFHNRWYDSELGKWISRDPIGELGGMNLYAYADNNPVNLWDVTGLCPKDSSSGIPSCFSVFYNCMSEKLLGINIASLLTGQIPGYTGAGILQSIKSYYEAQAFNYASAKGLISWNKSSVYRKLKSYANWAGKANVLLVLGQIFIYEVICLGEEWDAAVNGRCR